MSLDLVQSTPRLSCSNVKKIRIVVGWSRIQAGTQLDKAINFKLLLQ